MTGPPTVRSDIAHLTLANGLIKPVWLVYMTVLCAGVLGPERYGVMMAAWTVGLAATFLPDFGTVSLTQRDVAQRPARVHLYFSNMVAWRAVAAPAGVALATVVGWSLGYRDEDLAAVVFACVYMVAQESRALGRALLEARMHARLEGWMLVAERSFVMLLGTAALLVTRAASGTLAGMSVGMCLAAILTFVMVRRTGAYVTSSLVSGRFLRGMLKTGAVFGLITLVGTFYYRSDILVVERLMGEQAAGTYGLAYQLLVGLSTIQTIVVTSVMFPRLSRLWAADEREAYDRLSRKLTLYIVLAAVPIAAVVSAVSFTVSNASWLGEYGASLAIFGTLVWAFPFGCAHQVHISRVVIQGLHVWALVVLGIASLANVVLTFLLVPLYGLVAAAVVTIAGEAVVAVSYWFILRRGRPPLSRLQVV